MYPKLLQAKQAADLHSPGFNQRMVAEVMKDGFLDRHVPHHPRALQGAARAMLGRLRRKSAETSTRDLEPTRRRHVPLGAPARRHERDRAAAQGGGAGVAFVPGAAFYADTADPRTLRLSFVTASEEEIDHRHGAAGQGVQAIATCKRLRAHPECEQRPFKQVDVFTATPYRGNPLAVVLDGTGLDTEAMQHFTNWTNLSECTFLLPPTRKARPPAPTTGCAFSAPGRELPFAGHPTLGSCHAWLEAGGVPRRTHRAGMWRRPGADTAPRWRSACIRGATADQERSAR